VIDICKEGEEILDILIPKKAVLNSCRIKT
jgi:hypothetical protein